MQLGPFRCSILFVAATLLFAQVSMPQGKGAKGDVEDEGVKQTIEGLVRDIACPIQNHKSTARDFNLQCALECAKQGSPLVVLTDSGNIYLLTSQEMPDRSVSKRFLPLVGKRVKATGLVYERNGTHSISVERMELVK